jgi:two-component system chemotaxis response regulator CheB
MIPEKRSEGDIRVLVVDDSRAKQEYLTSLLEGNEGVRVVGCASDGREALRLSESLAPDLITLDLEMPKIDGFAFLRLLMVRRPCPVLVISGFSARDNVFRALELGALDFIAIADDALSNAVESRRLTQEVQEKLSMVRRLRQVGLRPGRAANGEPFPTRVRPSALPILDTPRCVVVVAASTGGPQTIQRFLASLAAPRPYAVLIAQHMPANFTATFAARLDGLWGFRVFEAGDGMQVRTGAIYIAPGGKHMQLVKQDGRDALFLKIVAPKRGDGSVAIPSADVLFQSAADALGRKVLGVVLTGMGNDATEGARAIRRAGGRVVAEDPASAIMPGMPRQVVEAGLTQETAAADDLHGFVREFVEGQDGGIR